MTCFARHAGQHRVGTRLTNGFSKRLENEGRLFGVAIVEASSLIEARMRASLAELGRGGVFSEGHALDAHCSALLTADDIHRMLWPDEAAALIARFERIVEKKPPAPSVRRRSRERARHG